MPGKTRIVIGGVDTHKDLHVAAVVEATGRIVGTAAFAADAAGYRKLLAWMRSFGQVARVGVEGTGAYGAGLARYLSSEGVGVAEVNRPDRSARRRRGKSDTVDAEAAARAALNGEATVVPKSQTGIVESIRTLRVAFCSARDSRTRVANQIRDLVVTAPDGLRGELGALDSAERAERVARFRISGDPAEPLEGLRIALRALGRRYMALSRSYRAGNDKTPCWAGSSSLMGPVVLSTWGSARWARARRSARRPGAGGASAWRALRCGHRR
jgi:transposase